MSYMFAGATSFDQDLGWCVGSSVTTTSFSLNSGCTTTDCGVALSCDPTPQPTSSAPTAVPTAVPSAVPTVVAGSSGSYSYSYDQLVYLLYGSYSYS